MMLSTQKEQSKYSDIEEPSVSPELVLHLPKLSPEVTLPGLAVSQLLLRLSSCRALGLQLQGPNTAIKP